MPIHFQVDLRDFLDATERMALEGRLPEFVDAPTRTAPTKSESGSITVRSTTKNSGGRQRQPCNSVLYS